jgi:hypothetical protein
VDRQTLELLKDSVIDLQVILPTLLNTITRVRELCKRCCKTHCRKEVECDCDLIMEEFDEHVAEVEIQVNRAEVLRQSANSTASLVSFTTCKRSSVC